MTTFMQFLSKYFAWMVFLTVLTVRLLTLSDFSVSPFFLPEIGDMKFYSDWGLRIAGGQLSDGQAFYGLPGYAYLLAIVYSVSGFDPFTVGVLQAVCEALTSVVLFKTAIAVFSTARNKEGGGHEMAHTIGIAAVVTWTVYQPAQGFSVILMPTAWVVLAYSSGVFFALRSRTPPTGLQWLGAGFLVGLVSTLVATVLFLLVLFVARICLSEQEGWLRIRASIFAAAALLLGVSIGMAPAWGHNYFVAKEPVLLSAHSGINFWIGNSPVANGYAKIPPGLRASQEGLLEDSIHLAQVEAGRTMKRYEVSQWWSAKANAQIRENPAWWFRLLGLKLHNFWNAFQNDDLAILKLLRDHDVLPFGLRFGVVAAFGLPGLLIVGWRYPKAWWVVAGVLLQIAALLPVFVTERYRMAAVPGLILLGNYFLWQLWNDLSARRFLPASACVALLGCSALFISRPQMEASLWSLDYYKAGIRATDVGEYDKAMRNLEIAVSYAPDSADVIFSLGNVWLGKGNRGEAKRFYRRALELNPNHERVLNNVGVLALEEKLYAFAERCFIRALKIDHDDPKVLYLLALTRFESGAVEEARDPLSQALRLRPQQREFLELAEKIRLGH